MMSRLSPAGVLVVAAIAPLAWGSTYVVTTELLPPDRPLFGAALRALPTGLLLLACTRVLPRDSWWWRAAAVGCLNSGLFFCLLFVAAYRLPGGVAGVLTATQPLLAVGFSGLLLAERPSVRKAVAGVAGVAGVALVVLRGTAAIDTVGLLAGLAASACVVVGTVLAKRWGRPAGVSALSFTGWQLTAGGLFLAPLAAAIEGAPPQLDVRAVVGYLYLALVTTAAANWIFFWALGRLSAISLTFVNLLNPLFAATLGWLVLGERYTTLQLLGVIIALGSIAMGQTGPPRAERGKKPGNQPRRLGRTQPGPPRAVSPRTSAPGT